MAEQNLKPANPFPNTLFKPETPKIALYLVLAQRRLTLQVVYLGRAHFRLPVRPPISPSRPTRETPAGRAGAVWAVDRAKRQRGAALFPLPRKHDTLMNRLLSAGASVESTRSLLRSARALQAQAALQQAAAANGTAGLTLADIDAEIAAARRAHHRK